MTIQLDPRRVRVPTGPAGKNGERKRESTPDAEAFVVPTRAHQNFVPEPESLMTMINSAVAALRKGVRWDRGTILNLVV